MSDSAAGHDAGTGPANGAAPEDENAPRRVIGTPPPAEARNLLGAETAGGDSGEVAREIPADPADLAHAKRAERVVATLFVVAMLAGIGFIVSYVFIGVHSVTNTLHSNLALGSCMAIAFLAMAAGFTIWVRHLMPAVEITEERKPLRSKEEDREAFEQTFTEGADASQLLKRPLLRRTLIAATVPVAVAPIVLLRDLGPLPGTSLDHTVWRKGMRILNYAPDGASTPIRPGDFATPGSMTTVVPAGYQNNFDALAKATAIIIKFAPGQLQAPTVMNWTVDNIVAYSKICTHLGCPAALYEQTTHHILCPCHQSTFDAARGARVIFGPATRALPQLPMTVDAQGYLVAASDFHEPVGPSFWERS